MTSVKITIPIAKAKQIAQGQNQMMRQQAYSEIGMLGLWCDSCCAFFRNVGMIPCPHCGGKARIHGYLKPEEVDLVMDAIQDCTHITGEKDNTFDAEEEIEAHRIFEQRLQEYDWWHGTCGQLQYIWYELRDQPWSIPGYYNCARRYFAKAYTEFCERTY